MFNGYTMSPLEPDHALLRKWQEVRDNEDAGLGDEFRHMQVSPRLLEAVNITINRRIVFLAEARGADFWQTPRETLERKTGDCEDIAILKYATLTDINVALGPLVVLGRIAGRGDHAFCVAGGWVMDNLFNQLVSTDKYLNFTPVYGLNGGAAYRFVKTFTIAEALKAKGR